MREDEPKSRISNSLDQDKWVGGIRLPFGKPDSGNFLDFDHDFLTGKPG